MAKTSLIHVAVEPKLKAEINRLAKLKGFSQSLIIRLAVVSYLEAQSKGQAA